MMSYEYDDFVWPFPFGLSVRLSGNGGYSLSEAKAYFWEKYRSDIKKELKTWLNDGWEPIEAIGPSNVEVHTVKKSSLGTWDNPVSCLLGIFVIVITLGIVLLVLLLSSSEFAEAVEFRVTMKRISS